MKRIVQPELLDTLAPDHPRAVRSRRDLQRINSWMRHHDLMTRALEENWTGPSLRQITELGAGDGKFLLAVARTMISRLPNVKVNLLDRQKIVSMETLAAFARCGWQAEAVVADVFDWPSTGGGIAIANLFLHHFEDDRLAGLLRLICQRAECFVALEPRRARWPLFCSRLLWAIGCNDVTRHDAVVSVRAGFSGHELSSLWPDRAHWRLTEQPAGAFSHLFVAKKISAGSMPAAG